MRKLILPVLAACLQASCSNDDSAGCEFSKATITASQIGTEQQIDKKQINDCFKRVDDGGLVEVKGEKTGDKFKVLYYKEADPTAIKILTVSIGGRGTDWRTSKGHDILKIDKPDSLGFIFGDRIKSKIKGTVMFTK
jgi:hypothetical protein